MRITFIILTIILSFHTIAGTKVTIKTNYGNIEVELFDKKSPQSVKNFLKYIDDGYYSNTIFHRVIDNYIIQGGGYNQELKTKKTHPQIKNEALNMVKNLKGTIAMARRRPKHSAKSEFYFNLKDNPELNHLGLGQYGFAVFGKITKGFKIAQLIGKIPTSKKGQFKRVPNKVVLIESITRN